MATTEPGPCPVAGRDELWSRLVSCLRTGADGRPQVVVLAGEPGIGKTTLLEALRDQAESSGFEVLLTRGTPTDSETGFASLLSLLRPVERRLDDLAGEMAPDLRAALTLGARRPADDVAVRLGLYRTLTTMAEDDPLVVLVDDVTRIDAATAAALAFTLGRLTSDPVVAVLTTDTTLPPPLDTLEHQILPIDGLARADVETLLRADGPIADEPLARCFELSAGNPLVALELARALDPAERVGDVPLSTVPRAPEALVRGYTGQLATLSEGARRALVVVAADDSGRLEVVETALRSLGEDPSALDEAEAAGMLRVESGHLRLVHPLLRAVAYHQVAARSRRAAHAALAAALDRPEDAAGRAWQLAAAADGADETAAEALELVALDVGRRGGPSSAARVLERAAALSPDSRRRDARRLAAAQMWLDAHDPERARAMLPALTRDPDEVERDTAVVAVSRWSDGPAVALGELRAEPDGPPSPWLAALEADLALDARGESDAVALASDVPSGGQTDVERRAEQLAGLVLFRCGAAAPPERPDPARPGGSLDDLWGERWVVAAAESGVIPAFDRPGTSIEAVVAHAVRLRHAGDVIAADESLAVAQSLVPERFPLARATVELALADISQLRGRLDDARRALDLGRRLLDGYAHAGLRAQAAWVEGRLALGDGDLEKAAAALTPAGRTRPALYAAELVCVLVALERPTEAASWLAQLERIDVGHAVAEARRARAVAASRGDAEALRRTADDSLSAGLPLEAAETRLVAAAILAATGQGPAAEEVASTVAADLAPRGVAGWDGRLDALAEAATPRRSSVESALTAAEYRVACAVAEGGTNKEVAEKLFLSVKTVDFHLQNIYRKLELRSRTELAVRLSRDQPHGDGGESAT